MPDGWICLNCGAAVAAIEAVYVPAWDAAYHSAGKADIGPAVLDVPCGPLAQSDGTAG